MKLRILLLETMVLLIGLALPHLPKGKDSKSQFVALNKEQSFQLPRGSLLAEPKYRPIIPPANVMANPSIRPKQDEDYCMHLKTHLDGKITDGA